MDLQNSHSLPLLMAFPALPLPRNQMERYVVLPTTRSTLKNGVPNVTARCGSCMLRASAIVEIAPCVHSVKKAALRSNHDG